MLHRLEIENYGLIERAEIEFSDGATMFTGETGSGKTMLLGALGFVLGERAGEDMVRRGARKTTVTLEFDPSAEVVARLSDDGYALDPGELASVVREMNDAGKSSIRINGRASTAGYVRDLATDIAEIVGQHEHRHLLAPGFQLDLLDADAANDLPVQVASAHAEVGKISAALERFQSDERKAQAEYDEALLALEEINAAAPVVGEDDRLTQRRRYLDNVERIALALRGAHDAIAGDDASASGALGAASAALNSVSAIDPELRQMYDSTIALQSEVTDLGTNIARALEATELDPGEVEQINARLELLDRLKRKHGSNIEAVLERAAAAQMIVRDFDGRNERAAELNAQLSGARARLAKVARELSVQRSASAAKIDAGVAKELAALAMPSARFETAFRALDQIGARGAEEIEFTFSANPGEKVRPLARAASGGELSRVLLALVVVLAQTDATALIFDEIDAGIGGATATAVAARIGRLAKRGQVACVTHLAQLASWADRHYVLDKTDAGDVTTISVREIVGESARAAELARMLSGEAHDVALEHARTLLRSVR
jgi:DNA repair protein RecN (Recombination protein N)